MNAFRTYRVIRSAAISAAIPLTMLGIFQTSARADVLVFQDTFDNGNTQTLDIQNNIPARQTGLFPAGLTYGESAYSGQQSASDYGFRSQISESSWAGGANKLMLLSGLGAPGAWVSPNHNFIENSSYNLSVSTAPAFDYAGPNNGTFNNNTTAWSSVVFGSTQQDTFANAGDIDHMCVLVTGAGQVQVFDGANAIVNSSPGLVSRQPNGLFDLGVKVTAATLGAPATVDLTINGSTIDLNGASAGTSYLKSSGFTSNYVSLRGVDAPGNYNDTAYLHYFENLQISVPRLSQSPPTALPTHPVGFVRYNFDNEAGSTIGNTGSGGAPYSGTLVPTATRNTARAVTGNSSLKVSDWSEAPDDSGADVPSVTLTNKFTISSWINFPSSPGVADESLQMIAQNATSFPYSGFKFYLNNYNKNDRALGFEVGSAGNGPGGLFSSAGAVPADDRFHHVTAVVDDSTASPPIVRLYVDGVLVASGNTFGGSNFNTTGEIYIGRQKNPAEQFLSGGYLDDFQIFAGQALTAQQVALLGASVWVTDGDGTWSNSANWAGVNPNAADTYARFADRASAPRTVTLDTAKTVGGLLLDGPASYTLAGTSTLTVDASTGGQIQVSGGSHLISAPLNLAKSSRINVIPAASTLTISNLNAGTDVEIAKSGAGTLAVNRVRASSLQIEAGTVRITPAGGAASTSVLKDLKIAGDASPTARLDLADSALILDYETGSSPIVTVRAQIAAGYASGAWTGNGITSTTAAANAGGANKTALGYAESSAAGTFAGQPVDSSSLLIRYTYVGDATLDGKVNTLDFNQLAGSFGQSSKNWYEGDFDYNGVVNSIDFTALVSNYGLTLPVSSPALGSVVPEPASLGLLAVGMLGMVTRRRRN